MALYEEGAPLAPPLLALEGKRTLADVVRRSAEWVHEAPRIVRGLADLAWPLRWNFAVLLSFNIAIAIWETIQPFILAWGVDTFEAKVPYIQIVAIIVLPVLAIGLPHGILLPLARDLYAAWFIKPRYEKLLGMLCLRRRHTEPEATAELDGTRAPSAQEGRDAAYALTEMLLRDPAFAVRGLVVLVILLFKSPTLVGILVVGMIADLWITMLMDARLFLPYARLRDRQFRVRGLEYRLLDSEPASRSAAADESEAGVAVYEREWDEYVKVSRFVETRRLIYQLPVREGVSTLIRVAAMLLVGWWVHIGRVSIGDYILFTSLAGRANDPLWVFLGFQGQIMSARESLRRLSLLCGVDFGLKCPGSRA
jgi:ABC-type multidrug transport system fused ATPase/permease subunit